MKKVGNIMLCIIPLVIALIIQVVVAMLGMIIYGVVQGFRMGIEGETDPEVITDAITNSMNPNLLAIITALAAVACLIVFIIWYKSGFPNLQRKNLKEVFTVKRIVYIMLLAIGIQFGTAMILGSLASVRPEWFEKYNELIESIGIGESWFVILLVVIIAPISEELIFRGVVLQYTKRVMPFMVGNILQAAMFGIYHMNIIQGLYAFVFGLFLGLVCERFGSIYGAILLHMIINLLGCFVGSFMPDSLFATPQLVIFILFSSIILIAFSTWNVYKEHTKEDNILISEEVL